MDENQIECRVEKMIDRLDARYMADGSTMTPEEYGDKLQQIDDWSISQYRRIGTFTF